MSRPPLPLGSYGDINVTEKGEGHYVAKARYRDYDGKLRLVERKGTTSRKAINNLKAAFTERLTPQDPTKLNRQSRIATLADTWWEFIQGKDLALRTYDRYREVLDGCILPRLGAVRLSEASVGVLDSKLREIATVHGPSNGKHARTVLKQMFALAAQRDALTTNPMLYVGTVIVPTKEARALSEDEVTRIRGHLSEDVLDVFDMLFGTGTRISEALGLRWRDVELDPRARVTISGAAKRVKGRGMIWEPRPKSLGSMHRLYVPSFTAEMLRRRPRVSEWVFPSYTGTLWDPSNFRTRLREQLKGTGFEWVHPHTIRTTVGTLLAHTDSLKAASAQLGHSSEEITLRHYVMKLQDAPDASEALEVLRG